MPDNKTHLQHGQNAIRRSKMASKWNRDSNIQTQTKLATNLSEMFGKEVEKNQRREKKHNKFDINARQISMLIHSNAAHISFDCKIKLWPKTTRGFAETTEQKKNRNVIWQFR